MYRHVFFGAALLAAAILTGADLAARGDDKDDKKPAEAKKAFDELSEQMQKDADEIKTNEDLDKFRKKYLPKLLAHAKAHPSHETACEALVMLVRMAPLKNEGPRKEALEILGKDHVKGAHVKGRLGDLTGNPVDEDALEVVRAVLKDHPDKETRATACKALLKADTLALKVIGKLRKEATFRENIEKRMGKEVVKKFIDGQEKFEKEEKKLRERMTGEFAGVVPYVAVGAKAPPLQAEDLNGKKVKLSEHEGKVVVVDFWATWCPPCKEMIPMTRKLVKKLDGKPFVFISVSADDEAKMVSDFHKKTPMPWTNWWVGPTSKQLKAWEVEAFPTVFLIDHKGVIRYTQVGLDEDDKLAEEAEKLVKEAEKDKKKE